MTFSEKVAFCSENDLKMKCEVITFFPDILTAYINEGIPSILEL